jgi:H+/Na+-translocating ferredoxin:NAD+ oxidoreductase subunit A
LLTFILVIGGTVQLAELSLRRLAPMLYRILGLYIPLMASNCAVLGVALLNSNAHRSLIAALCYGAGAALGFGLVLTLLAALRERIELVADVPRAFRGHAIALVTAGIMSLAFLGFAGFARL